MYSKTKNKGLFVLFILIILIIITILLVSVYSVKDIGVKQYKISLNNAIYDENYSYISLDSDAVLKKEWDTNYYLYTKNNIKYSLGTNPVFFDKSKNQVTIYGTVYQVYSDGGISEKKDKTEIIKLNDFQLFKLGDRKYLIVGESILGENFSASKYLIVSIDKAGNALLLNDDINFKTVNPLILSVGNVKFDVALEKLIINKEEIDLKKINGSTNEYVKKDEELSNDKGLNGDNNISSNPNNSSSANNNSNNTQIYNEIVNKIVSLAGLSSSPNKTSLYKNISLRSVTAKASYLNVSYSVVDPEDKYLSIFLILKLNSSDEQAKYYYLNKADSLFRINGLIPNTEYELSLNYISRDSSTTTTADFITVLTGIDPTELRITEIFGNTIYYNVKLYNEYELSSATVALTNCNGKELVSQDLNINRALSSEGDSNLFDISGITSEPDFICLVLIDAKDSGGNNVNVNSYHKVKIG